MCELAISFFTAFAAEMLWDNFSCVDIPVPFALKHDSHSGECSSICLVDVRQGANCAELLNMSLTLAENEV